MTFIKKTSILCGVLLLLGTASCTNVDITMPKGPKGDTGLSAYEFWKGQVAEGAVDWPKDQTEVADFFLFLKGKDGKDGKDGQSAYDQWKEMIADGSVDDPHNPGQKWPADANSVQDFWRFLTGASGEDGQTPHIGDNGNWFIGDEDTGILARGTNGKDGKDAVPPKVTIGENGNWFIDGVDTGKPAVGKDGKDGKDATVTIGDNGNWFIDGKDTGKPAVGKDGKSPEVAIGENGNWFIDGKDTGKPAFGKDGKDGKDGEDGTDGKSAYELWKDYIASGDVDNPHNPDQKWPAGRNKLTDFWDFLTGQSSTIEIQIGKYNVIPEYWNSSLREYVNPKDGSVIFTVYDKTGNIVGSGVKVSELPGVATNETFTTDSKGQFKVTWDKLPDQKAQSERKGSAKVTLTGGITETTAPNTLVPNRINVRMTITSIYPYSGNSSINRRYDVYVSYKFERQIDGKWDTYPDDITEPYLSVVAENIKDVNKPVNKANVDQTQFSEYSRSNGSYYIARPVVLTTLEEAYKAQNDTILRQTKRRWNGKDNYAAFRFGDGNGSYNDYGQKDVYLQDKIFVPEIYPVPGLKENGVFIEIKQGITTVWGEFDTENMPDFYPYGSSNRFTKDEKTNIWRGPEKVPASKLNSDIGLFIEMRTFINGTGGTVHTGTKELSKGGGHFKLTSAYPDNWFAVDVRRISKNTNTGITTYTSVDAYRSRYAYYLQKEGDDYYLVDFTDRTKRIKLEEKAIPTDWMN